VTRGYQGLRRSPSAGRRPWLARLDFYKDIANDVHNKFDASNFDKNHPSSIPVGINKKVIGMKG
jgi:hypothetical protein